MSLPHHHETDGVRWVDGIDVCEHHPIDFDEVRHLGIGVALVRAGRGTRQDGRWIEHALAAHTAGLAVGSYWHVYPSRTSAHHQAELWAAALAGAPWPSIAGHWADVADTDGLDAPEMGRYMAAFLRRTDELLGRPVGVFTTDEFWREHVQFGIADRPRWQCAATDLEGDTGGAADPAATARFAVGRGVSGYRTRAADRGGPGHHQVRADLLEPAPTTHVRGLHLVARGAGEPAGDWRRRWLCTTDVTALQEGLNHLGADLIVDGVFGPATDAAVKVWGLLCGRDGITLPAIDERISASAATARTAAP